MNCLCCGKQIPNSATESEKQWRWHKRCVKAFFHTEELPALDITRERLVTLTNETVNKGLTVPGVQKKLSLHLSTEGMSRLTIVDYPTGYILKPQTEDYDFMPEYEDLAMRLAELCGIRTVPHALIQMNESYAYITRRIDREITDQAVSQYAMEDFCQLSNRLTQDKYKGSYESCGRIVRKYSVACGFDLSELFLRVLFSFVIGNSDMHLKNFSLRETQPGNRRFRLSEAYDMLPVNVIVPEDTEQLALTLNGKKHNIHRKDFRVFAEVSGIPRKAADHMMDKICSLEDKFYAQTMQSYLPDQQKEKVCKLISYRMEQLV